MYNVTSAREPEACLHGHGERRGNQVTQATRSFGKGWNHSMFRRKNTGGYVLKLSPQGPKMRFKSEKEANEYLAKLKEKNAKYRNTENN